MEKLKTTKQKLETATIELQLYRKEDDTYYPYDYFDDMEGLYSFFESNPADWGYIVEALPEDIFGDEFQYNGDWYIINEIAK